jgi:hypothetical protein
MRQLTQREKYLGGAVGGVLFLLLTVVFINYLVRQHVRLTGELRTKSNELKTMRVLVAERALWEQREAWLDQFQPKLVNESSAGVQLLDRLKEAGRANGVTVENPAIDTLERSNFYRSTPVSFETKSAWPALIRFLASVQQPEAFLEFETVNIQIDPADPTQIRGKFRIGCRYQP